MKLWQYIIRRLVILIPTIIGLTFIVFVLSHSGGTNLVLAEYLNPHLPASARQAEIQKLIQEFHLNQPVYIQYFYWLAAVLQGDLGYTNTPIYSGPVTHAIELFMPNTIMLSVLASIMVWLIGIPLGVWSAVRRDGVLDQSTRVGALTLYSMPVYLVAFSLVIIFGVYLRVLPFSGTANLLLVQNVSWYQGGISYPTHILIIDALLHGNYIVALSALEHLILPALSLALGSLAAFIRLLRSQMLDVLGQDFIRFVYSKGVPEKDIITIHARRNAIIVPLTNFVYLVAGLLGGVVVIESIFNIPGIGYWTTQALLNNDVGGIMGSTLIFGITLVIASLIIDILYALIDPRIRY
jgi:ABC-type dipeptide/oligopeptide/nickel transport system permease component